MQPKQHTSLSVVEPKRGRGYTVKLIKELRGKLSAAERQTRSLQIENSRLTTLIREQLRVHDELWIGHGNVLMFSHNCLGNTVTSELEGWKISRSGYISPSIHCLVCGAHFTAEVKFTTRHRESRSWGKPWETTKPLPTREENKEDGRSNWRPEGGHAHRNQDLALERSSGRQGSSES